ncbi:MAG: glycosyltransferase family 2 protein [Candidatus Omnitrophica bacterium]|nr:glycosyltransferase family 2 protein [Candidatus Omnitrophota bacterium]
MQLKQISIIIPAYNEAESIGGVADGVRRVLQSQSIQYEILVVDDGSNDETARHASEAGASVLTHHINRGYGASLKTGIRKARYEWIALIDADGQHDPADIIRLIESAAQGFDLVIGARDRSAFQYASRMPGKNFLQWFAHFLVGAKPDDVNSGLRLFRKADVLPYFPILPNKFSFSTTMTLAMMKDAYEVGSIPIQTRSRQGRRSTVSLKDGLRTIMLIVRIAMLFNPLKVFLPISGLLFFVGVVYAAIELLHKFNIPSGAEMLMIAAVTIACFGVLADQLASIRRGG